MERCFQAKISGMDDFVPGDVFKGFDFPFTPVITKDDPEIIQLFQWGLIPNWAQPDWNRNYTLNARIETLDEKPSFKNIIANRCLIIVNGFYEWQHVNKSKIKYEIGFDDQLFSFAGLYDMVDDKRTYTLVTTEAQGVMKEIHNTKLRMPFALNSTDKQAAWLTGKIPDPDYNFTTDPEVYHQTSLF